MDISIRSVLTAGVTAVTATAIVAAPSVQPLPTHSTVPVALAASVKPAIPQPNLQSLLLSSQQQLTLTPSGTAVTPTLAPTAAGVNLANAIVNTYNFAEPWVEYGFQIATQVVAWIPVAGWFAGQIMVFYNFGQGLVASTVVSGTSWLAGNGSFLDNASGWVVNIGRSFIWLGLDEVAQFFPLPPIPLPPRPPSPLLPTYSAFSTLAAPVALAGPIGNVVIDASNLLAQASHAIWNTWIPVSDGIDYGVAVASSILGSFSYIPFVPLANDELNSVWNLINREGDALVGFANDTITNGNLFVSDAFNAGLIAATSNAFIRTVDSIGTRGTEAIDAAVDFGLDQLDIFTGIYIPHAAAANAGLQRVTTDPSASGPQALTDALRPLTEARDALKTELDAGAAKAAATVDRLVGDLPGVAAVNELVKKTRDTITVTVPPTVVQGAEAGDSAPANEVSEINDGADDGGTTIKVPRKIARDAVKSTLASVKAQADDNAKKAGEAAKSVDKGVQKLVKKLQKAGKNVERAVTGKTKKADG